jgi:hypothetical protein
MVHHRYRLGDFVSALRCWRNGLGAVLGPREFSSRPLLHHRWAIIIIIVGSESEVAQMRKAVLVALTAMLGLTVGLRNVAAQEVVSNANFYAQTSDGECGLEFTIAYRYRTVKGSIAWTDLGLRLRLPEKGFVVVDGKLSESAIAIFDAIVRSKKLAIGFYDGTILPIDLAGLDPTAFSACIAQTDALAR